MLTTKINYFKLIESALNAEMCRDLESELEILKPVWNDLQSEPLFDNLEPLLQAQMFRLCGFFLSNFGRAKRIPDYQMRGKDLLTKAIEIFDEFEVFDKAAEAKCQLALCYWREGSAEEAEIILIDAEERFTGNQLHPVQLQIQINRLIIHYWDNNYQAALKIIEQSKIPMEFCKDSRLQTMFHNQTALTYWCIEKYDKAFFHYMEAERFARAAGNKRFIGKIANNIANTLRFLGELSQANFHIERSIKIFSELGDEGWLAHVLDTKALIRLDEGKYEEALELVEASLKTQYKSGDAVGLIESLWTKCEILFHLERKDEGLQVYAELAGLATSRIGQSTVTKFAKKFADLIYVQKRNSYNENVRDYKKTLIRQSLLKNSGRINEAANDLNISHQSLSKILHDQFPELRDEFNLNVRAERGKAKLIRKLTPKPSTRKQKNSKVGNQTRLNKFQKIIPIDSGSMKFFLEPKRALNSKLILIFQVPRSIMLRFGVLTDALVCVLKGACKKDKPGMIFRKEDSELDCGIFQIDNMSGFVFLESGDDEALPPVPMLPEEIYAVGTIIGFCSAEDLNCEEIILREI